MDKSFDGMNHVRDDQICHNSIMVHGSKWHAKACQIAHAGWHKPLLFNEVRRRFETGFLEWMHYPCVLNRGMVMIQAGFLVYDASP